MKSDRSRFEFQLYKCLVKSSCLFLRNENLERRNNLTKESEQIFYIQVIWLWNWSFISALHWPLLFSKHIYSYITFKNKQIFRMCNFTSFLHYGSMIGLYILYVIIFKYTFFFFFLSKFLSQHSFYFVRLSCNTASNSY